MKNLSVEISEVQSSELEEVIEDNLGWNKALVMRALLNYFLKLDQDAQEAFVKKHGLKNKAKKRKEEVEK
ncbi:MAG: hypothetical protein A2Y89_00755 [Chloroflexi bacterium RBG_13_51_18]|nr:MAG: hypothetical protein A2Y89_00755 [Chloroflexi bacterium RBG_13_51_18]